SCDDAATTGHELCAQYIAAVDVAVHLVPLHVGRLDLHRPGLALQHAVSVTSLAEESPEHPGPLASGAWPIDADVQPSVVDRNVGPEPEGRRPQHAGVDDQHNHGRQPDFLLIRADRALE